MRVCVDGDNFRCLFGSGDWRPVNPRSRRLGDTRLRLKSGGRVMTKNDREMTAGMRSRAAASIAAATAAGVEAYVRQRHLPRVLPVGPDEIADESIAGRRRIVTRLARALRAERNRGRGGHWTYDLNRHIALRQAYQAERRWLDCQTRGAVHAKPPEVAPPAVERVQPDLGVRTSGGAAARGPSSWPAPSGPRHNSGQPSDSRRPDPTFPGNPRATDRNGSAGGASTT